MSSIRLSLIPCAVFVASCGLIPHAQPASETPTITTLDLSQSLAEWRASARPPARTVTVEHERDVHIDPGPACSRLGLFCLPLLPIALVFGHPPTTYDRATVTSHGRTERVGDFDATQRLFRAWLFDSHGSRVIQRVEMPSLHRVYLLESGHAGLESDGGMSRVVRSPILPQADVIRAYALAIDHPEAPYTGSPLGIEQWHTHVADEIVALLDEESPALLHAWIAGHLASDASVSAVVQSICHDPYHWRGDDLSDDARVLHVTRATLDALGPARSVHATNAEGCTFAASHATDGSER